MYHISSLAPRGVEIFPQPRHPTTTEGFSALLSRSPCPGSVPVVPNRAPGTAIKQGGCDGATAIAGMIREALAFLNQHPRLANLPFGKAIALLVRGSADLAATGCAGDRTDAGNVTLLRSVETVQTFLAEHPSVADAAIGRAAAGLAGHIAGAIGKIAFRNSAETDPERLVTAVRMAEIYLKEHPQLAVMPLGDAAGKLIEGARLLAGGKPVDPDLQAMARRVGRFVQDYPRLAGCDFGQIVLHLVGTFLATDTATASVPIAQAGAAVETEMSLAA